MLTVFAKSFMTATRIDAPRIRDVPNRKTRKKSWLPERHWWRETRRDVDLCDL